MSSRAAAPKPEPGPIQRREYERQAAIQRLTGQRNVVINRLSALDDPHYREDADALLANIDAVLDALKAAMVPEPRLNTLQQRVDKFLRTPQDSLLARYRRGRGAGHVAWHAVVIDFLERRPNASFPQVWEELCRLEKQDQDIIAEIITEKNDPACAKIAGTRKHPPGLHLHWRDRNDRLLPLTPHTVENFVSKCRHTSK